jgi:hypothetical protein
LFLWEHGADPEVDSPVAWPLWDNLVAAHDPREISMDFIVAGIYDLTMFGWRPDGAVSDTISTTIFVGDVCPCGDLDLNGKVNVTDVVAMTQVIFGQAELEYFCLADVNGDCSFNVTDMVYLIDWVFGDGAVADCDNGCVY